MSKTVKIANDVYQELRAVAEEKGLQTGEAADYLIRIAASRRAALAKYRDKAAEAAPAKKASKKGSKKRKAEAAVEKAAKPKKRKSEAAVEKAAKPKKPRKSKKAREDAEVDSSMDDEVEI